MDAVGSESEQDQPSLCPELGSASPSLCPELALGWGAENPALAAWFPIPGADMLSMHTDRQIMLYSTFWGFAVF